jgi:hypothetical protein
MIDQIDQLDESTEESGEQAVIPAGYFDVNAPVVSPEYEVGEASAKIELYTLKEAISDERISDILAGVLSSGLIEKPAEPYARGLVVFAQPQLDEAGEAYVHTAHLKARVSGAAQDLIVVIARTSARVNINLEVEGTGKLMRQLMIIAQEDVKLRVHSLTQIAPAGGMQQETFVVAGVDSEITIENVGIANNTKKILAGNATIKE